MRIGVDARAAAEERGGRGTVVRELLRTWSRSGPGHELLLYGRERWAAAGDLDWKLIDSPDPAWHLRTALHANSHCDAFLSTNSYLTAWALRVPTVVMVMDLVAFEPRFRPQRRAGLIERVTLPIAARRAAAFQCISRSTEADLIQRFPPVAGRTHVVPLAADERFRADGPSANVDDRPYVLGVGTLEPRKNLPRLVEAFASLPLETRGDRLLALVGPDGWDAGETLGTIDRHRALVRTLGFVPDEQLAALYRGADLFAYPSLYEGFGLPVLEAMRCGTAVLTSSLSSLPEVAGDAAVYVDPTDTADIRAGLARALEDASLRTALSDAGLERSAEFSWTRCASETIAVLERVSRGGG
jgi:glycosyltransferase involved in cell wall biosynthesis